jgi:hypothetical protein
VGSHFSIVLARNGVTRSVGTFFEHTSPLDKFFGVGHRLSPSETTSPMFEMLSANRARTFDDRPGADRLV